MRVIPSLRKKECGSTMIEAALVIPTVVVLMAGIMQYGFIFAVSINLRSATGAATRHLAYIDSSADHNLIKDLVEARLAFLYKGGSVANVNFDNGYDVLGSAATLVEVEYELPLFFGLVVPNTNPDGTLTLTARTVAR